MYRQQREWLQHDQTASNSNTVPSAPIHHFNSIREEVDRNRFELTLVFVSVNSIEWYDFSFSKLQKIANDVQQTFMDDNFSHISPIVSLQLMHWTHTSGRWAFNFDGQISGFVGVTFQCINACVNFRRLLISGYVIIVVSIQWEEFTRSHAFTKKCEQFLDRP